MTSTVYDADRTGVTDPAGKAADQYRDALGRLIQVTEDPAGLGYVTEYAYDALDHLVEVTQGVQTRTLPTAR